jgi:hypothetical protein
MSARRANGCRRELACSEAPGVVGSSVPFDIIGLSRAGKSEICCKLGASQLHRRLSSLALQFC